MSFWKDKKVLVTGGAGFVGSHLVEALVQEEAKVTVIDLLERGTVKNLDSVKGKIEFIQGDLKETTVCDRMCKDKEVVMHIAAKVGGVAYNVSHPGLMFYSNVLINTNILEAARKASVDRILMVSSACVYPRYCTIPTPEKEGFLEDPEPTNLGYGWAKRIAEVQARCYAMEYKMKIALVRPYNTYGPRDDFSPETSHVIPALIRRILKGENPLKVWGSGEQTRAFLYVTDMVKGLMLATEKYPNCDPVNIGTEEEVKIRDLAHQVVKVSGKNPEIVFETDKPSGQPRRNADISKAKKLIGYQPSVSLEEGLAMTVEWAKENL
ncbi:MAG: SDR family NAD(P)-dependent oxidoreductase [Candidatus Omnitrophica bacterium]|nr:SDR family NAD(P)-dependent oxidoreductase [Candidatus Omnitrophota bacterium]